MLIPPFALYTVSSEDKPAASTSATADKRIAVGARALAALDEIRLMQAPDDVKKKLCGDVYAVIQDGRANYKTYVADPLGVRNWAMMLGPSGTAWSKQALAYVVDARVAAAYGLKEEGFALLMERIRVNEEGQPAFTNFIVSFLDKAEAAAKKTPARIAQLKD